VPIGMDMIPGPIAPQLPPKSLSRPVRVLAGILGGIFVAAFLHEAVRHPAEGWIGALTCGAPMVWLIQGARTGHSQSWRSLMWFAVWYAIFASGWVGALALEGSGSSLTGESGIGVFLGSIAIVGSASSLERTGAAGSWRRTKRAGLVVPSQ